MSSLTAQDLADALTGNPEALDVHLELIERDVEIDGLSIKVHCHCLVVDGNGRVQPNRLAEMMRNAVADYAIPRSKLAEAKLRDQKYNSTECVGALLDEARRSFTDLAKTGEGGEMLLFLLAERFLGLPQILCKMALKTDSQMHYHGADGVYAGVSDGGILKLYWGESKIFKSAAAAVSDCLSSLAPFLVDPGSADSERERDLVLLSDRAELNDPRITAALRKYFDKTSVMSKRVEYCGIALVGFDSACYPTGSAKGVAEEIGTSARNELAGLCPNIAQHARANKIDSFHIELFCLPLPSAEEFRAAFLKVMGIEQ